VVEEIIPLAASYPRSVLSCSKSFPTTTAPSTPALEAIVYTGVCMVFQKSAQEKRKITTTQIIIYSQTFKAF
jgi:hypothetical protein